MGVVVTVVVVVVAAVVVVEASVVGVVGVVPEVVGVVPEVVVVVVGGAGEHNPAGLLVTPTFAVHVLAVPAVAASGAVVLTVDTDR